MQSFRFLIKRTYPITPVNDLFFPFNDNIVEAANMVLKNITTGVSIIDDNVSRECERFTI